MAAKTLDKRPQQLGNYEILSLLGAGGSSHIYKARHQQTGQLVAIKFPKTEVTENPVFLKRFEQEFSVARLLNHPNIVRVLQYAYADGKPYIVMEFIDGKSLGDRIEKEGALPEAEAVRIIAQAAAALHAAHKRKIIHRDVKPDNILLTAKGRAKVADLGLAKDTEADHDLTQPLRGMGTPNFIAPEQFNDAKHADTRCDVYGLAATLYMAVTGQIPFQAKGNMSIWKKKLSNELVPPRKLTPTLSERVERAICRALSADPNERPANCREFVRELRGTKPTAKGKKSASSPSARIPKRPEVERRVDVRFASQQKGCCRPLASEKKSRWIARVRDVSASGMGLIINRRFEPGTVLRVKLPGQPTARMYLVRVVRVQPHSARTWIVGCVFPRKLANEEVTTLL